MSGVELPLCAAPADRRALSAPTVSAVDPAHHRATNALARVAVEEIDRHGVIQHAARPGWCYRPPVRAAIGVEPVGHLRITRPEAAQRDADPDTGGKARRSAMVMISRGLPGHFCVPYWFLVAITIP